MPTLSVLIANQKDLNRFKNGPEDLYFQLPDGISNEIEKWKNLFLTHQKLIPWFPSVLIGEDYHAAIEFLEKVQPASIVTNNTGVAHAAFRLGIPWIAGPYLNVVNSFSLLGLKERFNCSGAFISNELSKGQIKSIKKPVDFKLYHSIYHPIVLLTSRQCLFHQVSGCEKSLLDETCIQGCEKSASITNLKGEELFIEKTRANYHTIYHEKRFLNTDVIKDIPGMFSSFFIDLRETGPKTESKVHNTALVQLFQDLLDGVPEAEQELRRSVFPNTHSQYLKGI